MPERDICAIHKNRTDVLTRARKKRIKMLDDQDRSLVMDAA